MISENQKKLAAETGVVTHQHQIPSENEENESPSNNPSTVAPENQDPNDDCSDISSLMISVDEERPSDDDCAPEAEDKIKKPKFLKGFFLRLYIFR